ncbi:hypothetical protein D3C81_1997820 [compost metagenome]
MHRGVALVVILTTHATVITRHGLLDKLLNIQTMKLRILHGQLRRSLPAMFESLGIETVAAQIALHVERAGQRRWHVEGLEYLAQLNLP